MYKPWPAADQLLAALQVTDVLELAQRLNLTVLRMWAFTDGSAQFAPLQPQLGMLDTSVLRRVTCECFCFPCFSLSPCEQHPCSCVCMH